MGYLVCDKCGGSYECREGDSQTIMENVNAGEFEL